MHRVHQLNGGHDALLAQLQNRAAAPAGSNPAAQPVRPPEPPWGP